MNSRLALITQPACRGPMGAIWTISPSISSTRSSGRKIPASAIRWYSSTVNNLRGSSTSMAIANLRRQYKGTTRRQRVPRSPGRQCREFDTHCGPSLC